MWSTEIDVNIYLFSLSERWVRIEYHMELILLANHKATKSYATAFDGCVSTLQVVLRDEEHTISLLKMIHDHPCTESFMVSYPWYKSLLSKENENLRWKPPLFSELDQIVEVVNVKNMKFEIVLS